MGIIYNKNPISEPKWRPVSCYRRNDIPKGVLEWLLQCGSMTKKLRRHSDNQVHIRVINHRWLKPRHSESELLGISSNERTIVREIEFLYDDQAWLFARSIFPRQCLRGRGHQLRWLGERALGEILFADPFLKRGEFEIAQLISTHRDYQLAVRNIKNPPDTLWARRSVFWLDCKPLLVSEVFLPDVYSNSSASNA